MSREFRTDVQIKNDTTEGVKSALVAMMALEYPDLDYIPARHKDIPFAFCGDLSLGGGQSDAEWADEIVGLIRSAAGKAGMDLTIDVTAYFLEELPREDYHYGPGQTAPDGIRMEDL